MGLLLNHIGEEGLDIYDSFTFLPARPNPIQGQPALPMEYPNHYETVLEKYADYFGKRDPQLMLREKFWFHLKREPSQTLESWVLAIKKLAAECKFPATYMNQAVRDKLTFSVIIGSVTSQIHETSSSIASPKCSEMLYKKSYGDIHSTGRFLFATGENPLHTLRCVRMELSRGETTIQEDVYIVRGVKNASTQTTRNRKVGTDA